MSLLDILGTIVKPVTDLIDSLTTSDEERLKLKNELFKIENVIKAKILEYEARLAEAQQKVLVAEAQGESWMQRNWRPLLMLSFGVIIVNNFILAPYLGAMFGFKIILEIPPDMWDLLKIGIGGYIAGRSVEKGVQLWKNKKD